MQMQVRTRGVPRPPGLSGRDLERLLPLLRHFFLFVLDASLDHETRRPAGRAELQDPEAAAPEVAELLLGSELVAVPKLLHDAVEMRRLLGKPVCQRG